MLTLSGILRYSVWPTKCCKEYYQHGVLIFARLSQHFSCLFLLFTAFSKHVKLCFGPLSGFCYIPRKNAGGGERGGGRYTGIAVSLCPSPRVSVCLLCPEDILWAVHPFVPKPDMVVHRPETVCHAQELGCYLQVQGHYKGLYNHNMIVSTIWMLYFLMVFLVFCCCCF